MIYFSIINSSSPKAFKDSRLAASIDFSISSVLCTIRIPFPPPPAVAFNKSGKPIEEASFTKNFEITDDLGNFAKFSLISKEEGIIEDFTIDDFELFTTTSVRSETSSQEIPNEDELEIEEWPEAKLTLHVESFEMNDNITGFDVRLKNNENQATQRWVEDIEFTANGVIGAGWYYLQETCGKDRVQVQFHARNRCFLCGWKKQFDTNLYGEESEASYVNNSIGEQYSEVRKRYRIRKSCGGASGVLTWWEL